MDASELLRLVDSLHRDKDIEKEIVFQGIEAALLSAARKTYGTHEQLSIEIDRETGKVFAYQGNRVIDPSELGRIAAQTAKQVMIQKIREAERDVVFEEFSQKLQTIVTGSVQRIEGSSVIATLNNRTIEAILPRSEQLAEETYHPGDRARALVVEVKKQGHRVKIVLSRTHPEFVKRLFEFEVPEIADGIVEILGLSRDPGHRIKIAVTSHDAKVDCVGACVGVGGSRIKNIVDELNGEKIDITRWSEDPEIFISEALKPAEIDRIILTEDLHKAIVIVSEDQQSLAIGKRGQNVRLASRLTQWGIDIVTYAQLDERMANGKQALATIPCVDEEFAERLCFAGFMSFQDVVDRGLDGIKKLEGISDDEAEAILSFAEDQVSTPNAEDSES